MINVMKALSTYRFAIRSAQNLNIYHLSTVKFSFKLRDGTLR